LIFKLAPDRKSISGTLARGAEYRTN